MSELGVFVGEVLSLSENSISTIRLISRSTVVLLSHETLLLAASYVQLNYS